jgi:hypothetical protein
METKLIQSSWIQAVSPNGDGLIFSLFYLESRVCGSFFALRRKVTAKLWELTLP